MGEAICQDSLRESHNPINRNLKQITNVDGIPLVPGTVTVTVVVLPGPGKPGVVVGIPGIEVEVDGKIVIVVVVVHVRPTLLTGAGLAVAR